MNFIEEQILKVKEFMIACGQEVPDEKIILDENTFILRKNLLVEEYEELQKAVFECDLVEIADALTDILYVSYGSLLSLGISSFNKYISPNNSYSTKDYLERLSLDMELYKAQQTSLSLDILLKFIIINTISIAKKYDIPIEECFDEVHSSNMTKVLPNGKVLKNEYGKIMKPETYRKPDLNKIIFKK